jgi:hypothetical protein
VAVRRGMLRRRLLGAAGLLLAGAAALPALGQAAGNPLERAVKATYLYKFGPFVTWPQTVFASSDSPVNLCVAGEDPFGRILEEAVASQTINGRPILLRRLPRVDRHSGCHILFASGSPAQSASEALSAVRGTPVLTFTDAARGTVAKGIIHFVVQDNRVRFEIDEYAAAENGIAISSRVLSLAISVRPRS